MILDSASKGNEDNSLSTFYLEYRGSILSIVHSNINGVDYIGGTIKSDFMPNYQITWSPYQDGLPDFIKTFKEHVDYFHARRAIKSLIVSD